MKPSPTFLTTQPTLLAQSLLTALGLLCVPVLAAEGAAQCSGALQYNLNGSLGTPLCPDPSATAVSSHQAAPTAVGGNPINLLTGNKFEQILDIDAVGDAFALRLTRYYNSQSNQRGLFGMGWRSDYELQLQDLGDNIQILGADGTLYRFNQQSIKDEGTGLFGDRFVSDDISLGYVVVKPVGGSETMWQWHLPDGRVMDFAAHRQVGKVNEVGRHQYGQLSRVHKPGGGHWQLRYNTDGKLARVSNHLGDVLRFDYPTTEQGLASVVVTRSPSSGAGDTWYYYLDNNNNLSQVVSAKGDRLGYEYTDPNDTHNLTAKYRYDTHGQAQLISRFAYDAYDRAVLSAGDNDVGKITVSYDDRAAYPTQGDTYTNVLTNSLGQSTKYHYTYDKTGLRLLSALGAGCLTCNEVNVRYEYNKEGWVVAKHQLNPNTQDVIQTDHYAYDNFGRVIQTSFEDKTSSKQDSTSSTYYAYVNDDQDSPAFYLIKSMSTDSVSPGKQTGVEYDYDDRGNVIKVRAFGYEGGGDALERTWYYGYNQEGLLEKVELSTDDIKNNSNYAKTELIRFAYNEQGQLIHANEQGLETKYAYDNQGNVSVITHPDGRTVHYTYNTHNQPTHIKMGNQFVAIDYDNKQRPIAYTNHLGQTIDIRYDDIAHSIHYTLADGQVVSDVYNSEYDFIKRSVKDGQGKVIFTSLGSEMMDNGLLTQNSINPINTLIINNALAKLTLNTGATYTRQYDDFGRVRLATDANTGKRHIQYDHLDRPTHIKADGINQEMRYHALGLPSRFEACSPNNNSAKDCQYTHYHYDSDGKLTKVEHQQTQDGKAQDGQNGQISSIHYQYTDAGLLASETTALMPNHNYTTTYHYDDKDRINSVSLPEGITLHYHYNHHSQVAQIDYQTPTSTLWQTLTNKWYKVFNKDKGDALLSNIQADSTRGLLALTHANGSTVSQSYDNQARLTSKHDHTTSTKVGYDKQTGDIKTLTINDKTTSIDELTNAYTYDSNGNRTSHTSANNQETSHYTYQPNSDRLSTISTKDDKDNLITNTHYTYDNLGNPVMITTKDHKGDIIKQRALTYTPDGQIQSIKDALQDKQGNQTEKLIATYQYNHLRQRVSKTTYDDKQNIKDEVQYLWDKGLLSAEIKDGKVVRRYVYLDIMPVAVLDYGYDSKGKLNETKVYSIHTDHLGTPKAITNQNKEVVWSIGMDTFGKTKAIQAKTITDLNANTQRPFEFNLRFAGQYFDQETGYHYNYHRYYDPSLGRYLTSDPIGLAGGLNSYGYAYNRPYMASDVYGLYAIGVWDKKQAINITIPVLFTDRASEFPEKMRHWKSIVEKTYTGRFGEFDITTKVDLLQNDIKHIYNHINTIAVKYDSECDPKIDNCNNHLKNVDLINEGTFFLSAYDNTIIHEFGHVLGIRFDPYFTKPIREPFSRWQNVMGSSPSYSHADWLMFSVIFDSPAFEWQGCKPEFEKYNHMLDAKDSMRKSQE